MFALSNYSRILFLLSSLLFAQNVIAAIDTQIDASRLSGVAPLAIFFDASATTGSATTKPFHELHYTWDFGDQNAGQWQYGNPNNRDKNKAYGPVAAHVFETPGVYTINLVTKGLNGDVDSSSVTITVQNPDAVFDGSDTLCFSTSGSFSGCPGGAQHVSTNNFQSAMSNATAGKRLLFRRGETFTASGGSRLSNNGPGLIGAFGSGNRPVIRGTTSDDLIQLSRGRSGHTNDWRLMDLDLVGSSNDSEMVRSDNTVENFLMLRLRARNFFRFNAIANSALEYYESDSNKNIFVVESDFKDSGFHGIYVSAEGLALLGNEISDAPNSHIVRITYANPAVVSNNYLHGETQAPRHVLKFHSFNPDKSMVYNTSGSGKFVISDNVIEHGTQGSWMVALGPESANQHFAHNMGNGIFERNHFKATSTTQVLVKLWVSDVTMRNNLFDVLGATNAVDVDRRHAYHNAPSNNFIYSNTFHTDSNSKNAVKIGNAAGTQIRNNLLYTGNGAGTVFSGSAAASNNIVLQGLGASNPERFVPTGAAIDGVLAPVVVLDDFKASVRATNNQDIGAYESGGGAAPPPTPPSVTLTAAPSSINVGSSSTLSWTSSNADTCTANGWSGSRNVNGSQSVTPNTTTTYKLTCTRNNVSASASAIVTVVSQQGDTSVPSVPANISASETTHNNTRLSWSASSDNVGVTNYNVYRNGTLETTAEGTSAVITGLSADTTYSFTVSAQDAAGNMSNQSASFAVATASAPGNDEVSGDFSNWQGANGYTIGSGLDITLAIEDAAAQVSSVIFQVWSSANGVEAGFSDASRPFVYQADQLDTVTEGSRKYVQALLRNASGNVIYRVSERTTFSTQTADDTIPPSTPANIVSSNTTQTSTMVSWNASTDNVGVTAYDVYRDGTLVATIANTSSAISGLSAETTYRFTISARDAAGNESSQSSPLSVTTLSLPETEVSGNFNNWQGADGYTVGSGFDIDLSVNDSAGVVASVIFQVWSRTDGVEADYRMTSAPYVYQSSQLDAVEPGSGKYVQALLMDSNGELVYRVSEKTAFSSMPPTTPTKKLSDGELGALILLVTSVLFDES